LLWISAAKPASANHQKANGWSSAEEKGDRALSACAEGESNGTTQLLWQEPARHRELRSKVEAVERFAGKLIANSVRLETLIAMPTQTGAWGELYEMPRL
jgi:hypothetical protein